MGHSPKHYSRIGPLWFLELLCKDKAAVWRLCLSTAGFFLSRPTWKSIWLNFMSYKHSYKPGPDSRWTETSHLKPPDLSENSFPSASSTNTDISSKQTQMLRSPRSCLCLVNSVCKHLDVSDREKRWANGAFKVAWTQPHSISASGHLQATHTWPDRLINICRRGKHSHHHHVLTW